MQAGKNVTEIASIEFQLEEENFGQEDSRMEVGEKYFAAG